MVLTEMVNWERMTLRNATTFVFLLLMGTLDSPEARTETLVSMIAAKYPTVFSKEELSTVSSIFVKWELNVRFTEQALFVLSRQYCVQYGVHGCRGHYQQHEHDGLPLVLPDVMLVCLKLKAEPEFYGRFEGDSLPRAVVSLMWMVCEPLNTTSLFRRNSIVESLVPKDS